MFCRCNYCDTQFAVSAAQIRAGRGQVRCGTCMTVFDALDTLSDEVDLLSPTQAAAGEDAPQPVEDATDDGAAGVPGDFTGDSDIDLPADPPFGPLSGDDRPADAPAETSALIVAGERLASVPAPLAAADVAEKAAVVDADEDDIPEVLREDMARLVAARRARRAAMGFGAGCLLLVAALLAQWAWFKPADVLARYPQARPWLERLCEQTGCVLPDRRDASRVRMVTRDVRVHPRYEGALRVTASLMNTAPFTQPFPRLHFILFNVNGQVIASRVFEPQEYLPEDVDAASEMRPRVPVQVALELLAPEDAAVSFEFDFL